MGHGHQHIKPTGGVQLPTTTHGESPVAEKHLPKSEEHTPNSPKANAAALFDKKWQDTQAADKRGVLATLVPDGKEHKQANGRGATAPAPMPPTQPKQAQRQIEQSKNLLSQSWNDLLGRAKEHKNLENFRSQPKEFWDKVRQMSEIRIVESYVKGKLEPRAASRYGDLLEMLTRRGGDIGNRSGNVTNFLNSLPRGERNVFLARLQISQTFGANELFTGRAGVALDRSGRFGLQTFLAGNGKSPEIGAHTIISLAGGDLSAEMLVMLEKSGVFANAPMLFDSKSASLLGLTLALLNNTDAMLSLDEMNFEAFMPKTFGEMPSSNPLLNNTSATLRGSGNFENSTTADNAAVTKRAGEMLAAGALVSGALATIEQHQKANKTSAGSWTETAADDAGFKFSAGSTGAMMGATVGCVVPLAQKSVGEILGFAASVVVGLTDSGLRTLGANALVSVITGGVQTFLNVSSHAQNALPDGAANNFLNAAQPTAREQILEKDLRQVAFNRRSDAFLTS